MQPSWRLILTLSLFSWTFGKLAKLLFLLQTLSSKMLFLAEICLYLSESIPWIIRASFRYWHRWKSYRRKIYRPTDNLSWRSSLSIWSLWSRLGICRDRRDRWSCKSFVSCVNFSRKQRSFLHILQVYTHLNVNFLHNC